MHPEGTARHGTTRLGSARALAFSAALVLIGSIAVNAQGPAGGANVNVVAGNGPAGDWTLQRQNEPTMACSSRNPLHCLAGANDYRTVDIPFPADAGKVVGDAWLGWYATKDGGLTWRSRLLPGFPQDGSPQGLASPIRGYTTGADPVIRAGTNGLFFYVGLAFDRSEGGPSAIFVSRFIDNNNVEGVGDDPIAYIATSIVDRIGVPAARRNPGGRAPRAPGAEAGRGGAPVRTAAPNGVGAAQEHSSALMVDKPWLAVDVPRSGAQTCTIGGPGTGMPAQSFPGGRAYVVYSLFDGSGAAQRGRVMFTRSLDCGQTWSTPRLISRIPSADVNGDGVANAADTSLVYASLNQSCGQARYNPNADFNNDCRVNAIDLAFLGQNLGKPVPVQPRLSQGATLAIDPASGALQLAWRQFADGTHPDAIVTVRSNDGGTSFSAPLVVGKIGRFDQGSTDTSFRTNALPTMAMDGSGRAYLAWATRGLAPQQSDPASGDSRIVIATSTNGTTWTAPRVADNAPPFGHQIMPALAFAQGKLQLVYYDLREDLSQLFGPFIDEQPILAGLAELRHTIEVRGAQADPGPEPVFTSFRLTKYQTGSLPGSDEVRQLQFNPPNLPLFRAGTTPFMGDYIDVAPAVPFVRNGTTWSFNTAPSSSPVFHAIWTDNRDVRPPANGDWTSYTPPNPPFERPAMSGFDPTIPVPPCVPGRAGMRNQNVYTTRITQGLVVGALTNSKPLGDLQRSFPVFVQNNSAVVRTYRLTIANQPPGGDASFQQFSQLTTLDASVPPRSTIARTVFVRSSDPRAQVNVNVIEVTAPGGAALPDGQQGTIVLNPDPTNPDIANPDIANPDIANPDIANPDIANPDIANPDIANVEVFNPDIANPAVRNPDIANPDIANPDIANPDIANTTVVNPDIANPDIANPDIANPDIANPDIANPDIANPDIANGSLSDTTWIFRNNGNTSGAFTVKLALSGGIPAGFKSQLIAHKLYQTPAVLGCDLTWQPQTVLLANITNPTFVAPTEIANPDIANPDIANLTIALGPGETARITLRVLDPNRFDAVTFNAVEEVSPAVVSQAVNSDDAAAGVTQPPAAGVLTSNEPVPGGAAGGAYSATLDGVGTGTWTVVGGQLPPGTTLDGNAGTITGTPTAPGSYTVTLRYDSTTGLVDFKTITITVAAGGGADLSIASAAAPDPVALGSNLVYTLTARNLGPEPATSIVVRDTLPAATTFVSATSSQGTCTQANGTVLCNIGSLASGGVATMTLTVLPTAGGPLVNEATISGAQADPVITNNTVRTTTTASSLGPCTTVCFSGPLSYPAGPGELAFSIDKADFNEDGHLDLVFSQATEAAVSVLFGNGSGGFGPPTLIATPAVPLGATVGDFNNDGHADIVVNAGTEALAWVFLGTGTGAFGAPQPVDVAVVTFSMATGDVNHDGNLDIVLGSGTTTSNVVVLVPGNGDGTFDPPVTFTTGAGQISLVLDDLNGDGNLDVAAANRAAASLSILLGDGLGGFTTTTTAFPNVLRVRKVGDLNRDGLIDLVVSDTPAVGANRLLLLLGDGTGAFGPPVDLNADTTTAFATSADLDGDGDLDLLATRGRGGLDVRLNDGTGTFAAPIVFPVPPAAHFVVEDLNGDGRPDVALAVGNSVPSQVLVLLNTCDAPPADLAVSAVDTPDPVTEGQPLAYDITVTNNGPNAASDVQLTVGFGPSAKFQSVTGTQGTCSVNVNLVTCQLGTLGSGDVATFQVIVLPLTGGTLPGFRGVTATTGDPNPANNTTVGDTVVTPAGSLLVVTNTNDAGPGSFRQALLDANGDGGPRDTIVFAIEGAGPHVIRPNRLADLPVITQPVVIDGTTQPGYSGTPVIEISGENADSVPGLVLNAGNTVVRGLAITRFPRAGILIQNGGGNLVESNYIGTNASGAAGLGNGENGLLILSAGNTIGGTTTAAGNVISGNAFNGVHISSASATNNVISGNYIGVNPQGTAALPNSTGGIAINGGASGNTVGGASAAARNVISGNTQIGVQILAAGTSSNSVIGNYIGTNAAGTAAIPNGLFGVLLASGATGNLVGGAGVGNVISGNGGTGLRIVNEGTTGNVVRGNLIGTSAAGTAAIPNAVNGAEFDGGATGNTIGGLASGERNVISGNAGVGVGFFGAPTNGGNSLPSNFIGTDVTGTAPLGNAGTGVYVQTSGNTIGSLTVGGGNVIAFNGFVGVRVDSGTGNAIAGNRIFSNASLGIDLAPLGVTPNDPGDADEGPNNLLNTPVFTSATLSNGTLRVIGTLGPFATGLFQVHFFSNSTCDPSGSGEGETLLGVLSGLNNNTGDTSIDTTLVGTFAAGQAITATLTDSGNNTSEFSPCVTVTLDDDTQADLAVTKVDTPDPVDVGAPLTYTITVTNGGPDPASAVSLTDQLPAAVTFGSATPSQGSCSGTTPITCQLGTLASGAAATVTIVVTPTTPGQITNTATVGSGTSDPNAANNSATATTTVANVPQTFVVTSTNDAGTGSLREAIAGANADPATHDTITFNIPGAAPFTIAPATALPALTGPVTIDATTQPGGPLVVEISGADAGATTNGLVLNGANSEVRGLVINRWGGSGITVNASATDTRIEGNLIGTTVAGTAAAGNGFGVTILASNVTVGGLTSGARNVLSGNLGSGVRILGPGISGSVVQGNLVGTDITGTSAVPNQGIQSGIFVVDSAGNTIGGTATGAGNVVSGNTQHAITIVNAASTGNLIQGNLVGTAADGTTPLGNGGIGIDLVTAPGNTIGGVGDARNIVANNNTGIQIRTGADGNVVRNNLIASNGGIGIRIDDTSGNIIGGSGPDQGNQIQSNGTGVVVLTATSAGNAILGNSISDSTFLGIDIDQDGVTANDLNDVDAGPNGRQNYPSISSAVLSGSLLTIQGTLNSAPGAMYRLEFFEIAACNASGHGEGRTFLGALDVTTDGAGNATFTVPLTAVAEFVAATATDAQGNTSEFSNCVQATAPALADLSLTKIDTPDPVNVGSPLTYTITVTNNGPDAASGVTVADQLSAESVTFVSATPSQGSCSGTTTVSCALGALASGAQATVTIVVMPTVPGQVNNTATVTSTTDDPNGGNNGAIISTTVANVAQTFVVTNTNDAGPGSLRAAMLAANTDPQTHDTITFNIAGTAPFTIAPTSALPILSGPVTIDGTTQPGFDNAPIVELSGQNAGAVAGGIVVNAGNSVIRGLVINRFSGNGILVQGGGVNRIEGNWLGVTASGDAAAPNGNGIIASSSGNVIGGTTAASRNVLSGNTIAGVQVNGVANVVQGNLIGTDHTGTVDLGNAQAGVLVTGEANIIGGITTAERNVISGNNQAGVRLAGGANANQVQGNFIGTNLAGTGPLPNGVGVALGVNLGSSASTNTIGGLADGAGNLIAFNSLSGVVVAAGSSDNAILRNSIASNGTLGIDLNGDGITANDPGDADEGPNNLQNFPVLTAASGGVTGTLNSIPNTTFRIEFFGNPSCDPTGNGEGATFLGFTNVTTDASGNAAIPHFGASPGHVVTATATDAAGNTSEFSACVQATAPASADLSLTKTDTPDPVNVGSPLTYTITVTNNGPDAASGVTVTDQLPTPSVTFVSATPSQGTCSGTATVTCPLGTIAAGAAATVTIVVTPTVPGQVNNTATVASTTSDPNSGNNGAIISTTVGNVPQTFVVTNTNDTGPGSLRAAILAANADQQTHDTIAFNIPGTAPFTIAPASALPMFTGPVTVDGTTQPGFDNAPIVEISGATVGGGNGLVLNAGSSVVRGLIINRFQNSGIVLQGGDGNRIEGNWLGLAADGAAAAGNANGVFIDSDANVIGGATAATRNIVSGNTFSGVQIRGTGNVVHGNSIGTNPAGTASIGNATGVILAGEANVLGSLTSEARNVISGNNQAGVTLGGGASANTVLGNYIGTDVTGTAAVANLRGISLGGSFGVNGDFTASSNTIGGLTPEAGNLIAFNTAAGIVVAGSSTNNAIWANAIRNNGELGIDLGGDGVSANDPLDADEGPNERVNFPVLTAASGGVTGTLNSIPNTTFRIEFFGNPSCDPTGNGEGATFLGFANVTTDGSGNAVIPLFGASGGQFITATATDGSNNTSEFSACAQPASGARTWINNNSGFWEDPANWSDGVVPADGDTVVIDRPGVNPVITVQSAVVTLAGLRSEEPLHITGGALTIDGPAQFNAGFTMSAGSIAGSGDITLGGGSIWTGGQIGGSGTITVEVGGSLNVSSPGQTGILARTINNLGTLFWNQAQLQLTNNAIIVNYDSGVVVVQSSMQILNASGGALLTLINEGFMAKTGGGPLTLDGVGFYSSGVLQLQLGSDSDRIVSNATATVDGVLDVRLQPGFTPTVGSQFEVLQFSQFFGAFDLINGNGQTYTATYTPTGLTLTVEATPVADLGISKTDSPDPVERGGQLTYTITVLNNGPNDASNVGLNDLLPPTVTFVSVTTSQGSCTGGVIVTCSLGVVAANTSATVSIVVTPNAGGTIENTASVFAAESDPTPANNVVTITTTVTNPAGTFTVTTTADSGPGSLRQAILDANASTGSLDTIDFNIPGAGPHAILPLTFLPVITDPVVIDATTQPGYGGLPVVELDGTNAGPQSNGLHVTAGGSTIRGLAINRFGAGGQPDDPGGAGIVLQTGGGNVIERNFIGTDPAGLEARPNRADGIFLEGSPNNTIGGADPFFNGNLLSGNARFGLMLNGAGTTGNAIRGNRIGTTAFGAAPLGNGAAGVAVFGASQNLIGGPTVGTGNTISGNDGAGVLIASGTGNLVSANSIESNGGLGIDLGNDGLTQNDPADADAGANNLQNFPVLSNPVASLTSARVRFTFNGLPDTVYTIEAFINQVCDASGNGEGATWLSNIGLTTDATGAFEQDVDLPGAAVGRFVTATVRDPANNTSEFSACLLVPHTVAIVPQEIGLSTREATTLVIGVTRPPAPGGDVVQLSSSNSDIVSVPPSVTIPDNALTENVEVTTGTVAGTATITATAPGLVSGTATVTVTLRSMTLSVSTLIGVNRSVDGTVQLAQPAPAGGVSIALTSAAPAVFGVDPSNVVIPAGATSAPFTVNGLSSGAATLTATAPGFATTSTTIEVTSSSLISLGQGLVVAPGNTASLSLSLGIPAPPGGITVALSSSNTAIATVTPSVFIPEGLQVPASNPVITGVSIGTVEIGATATGFAPDSTAVSVTLSLSFDPAAFNVVRSATANTLLRLSAPAPAGGLTLNLSTDSPATASVPPTVTIGAGLTSGTVTVTGVELGSTTLRASAPDVAQTTAAVTVVPEPALNVSNLIVGRDLQVSTNVSLGAAAPPGGLTITATSANPALVALSNTQAGAGSASINIPVVSGGFSSAAFFVQALDGAGSVNVTFTAPGYASETISVALRPSGFIINSPGSFSTNTLAANTSIQIASARLNATTLNWEANQSLRGGLSVNVPVTSSDGAVGTITVSPVQMGPGIGFASTQFDPAAEGQSTITVGTPPTFSTPAAFRTIVATVTAPTVNLSNVTIGKDLQVPTAASLSAQAPAGGLTVTITSGDPNLVRLSTTATGSGEASIQLPVSAGSSSVPSFFVQALGASGTVDLTATAPGYAPATSSVTLQPSGFIINSPGNVSTNSFAANTPIQIASARLNPTTLNWAANQPVRGGLTVNVDVTSSNTTVGTIVTSPVVFNGGDSTANTAFDPAQSGSTTIAVTPPAGFGTPTTFVQITATVSAPNLNIGNVTVGRDLQAQITITLESPPPSPVDVTIRSSAIGTATITTDGAVAGTDTVVFTGVTTTTVGTIFVQGRGLGTATLTADADGYDTDTGTVTVHPSGFIINSPGSFTTNTFAANINIQIASARLTPGTLAWAANQPIRGGLSVNVPVTSDDENVGQILQSPVTIGPGQLVASTQFDPRASGTAIIAAGVPAGFDAPSTFRQITATVTAPRINLGTFTIGRDLQVQATITLDIAPPSPVTVTVRSNATSVATITQNGTVEGGQTIVFPNVTTTTVGTIFIQGRALGSTTLTADAAGYDDGTANVTVEPSGFIVNSPGNFTTNTFAANTLVQVASARLNPATLNWAANQPLRGGLSVQVPVTVGDPDVGVITVSPVTIGPGVGTANTAFDPVGIGATTISVATPAGFSTPSTFAQITATVTAPGINISNVTVGKDLQLAVSISLDAAPPTPTTFTVRTSATAVSTVSGNPLLEGGETVTFTDVSSTTVGTIYVQGRSIGAADLIAEASGYAPATRTVQVDPSGFIINSPGNFTTSAGAANTPIQITPARLDPFTLNWAATQALRGGLTLEVPVTSSNPAVGTLTVGTVAFGPSATSANTAFDPLAPGSAVISVGVPAGFSTPSNFRQVTATVGQ